MGFFSRTGKILKPLVNFPKWMGLKRIKEDASFIKTVAKQMVTPQKATRTETFDEALKRLDLSEAQLVERYQALRRIFFIYVLIALPILAYALYLYSEGSWHGQLLITVVLLMVVAQAFRYNFWMFQLRQRRLGCSFREWYRHFWIR